jgi:hypothetical protein
MADLSALYQALRNADAAGDTEGARRLAQYIQQTQATPVAPPDVSKAAPFSFADTALAAAQSALGATKSTIEGVTGAGSTPGEYLSGLQKKLGEQLTPERQAEMQRRAALERKAAETGKPLEEVMAGVGGVKEAPIQTLAQAAGSSVPTAALSAGAFKLGTKLGAPGVIAAGVGIAANYLIGALQGAGEVKGSIYDAVTEALINKNVPEADAKKQALAAQNYLGNNWDVIAQGLGLGALAGGTGAEAELLKRFTKPVAKQIAAKEAAKIAEKGAVREFGEAIGKEAVTEGLQGGQGQYAENVALNREGFLTNAMKGVYGAAARDAAMGAIGGGGIHAIAGRPTKETPSAAPSEQEPKEPEQAPEEIVPGAKLREDAPVGKQGTLFTRKEMGSKIPEPKAVPEPPIAAAQQGEQLGLGLDFQRDYNDLATEREALRAGPRTAEARTRIAELTEQMASYDEATAGQRQAEEIIKAERDAKKAKAAVAPVVAEPVVTGITQADIDAIGLPLRTSKQWVQDNVLGKTVEEIQALVQREPNLINNKGARAEVLKALIAPQPTAFEEKPNVQTTTKTDQSQGELDLGGGKPSVGVPSELASTDVVQPGAGVSTTTGTSATPDGLGLAPVGQPAGKRTKTKGTQPPAVTTPTARTSDQIQDEIRALQTEQQSLLTKAGRIPAAKSPARATWDAFTNQIAQKKTEWDALDQTERKAKNAPTTTTAPPSPAATTTTTKGSKKASEPTPKITPPKEDKAPPASKAAEPVKSRYERLLDVSNNESIPIATRKQAEKQMDLMDDPTMNTSKAARKANEEYADRFLTRVEGFKSVAIAEGQSLDALKDEVKNTKGVLGTALRRMVESGKVVLEDAHPSGKKIGGFYDGEKVTLYADGIPSGQSMAVALHEVGAHLGMEKLLGKKQYNAVIDRILDMVAKGDGSTEAKMAQAAYKRIPVSDFNRGAGREEMVAYFVEEMAKSEAAGTLPKIGPMRVMWNQIKTAIVTAINKALGTNFGVKDFSAQDILDIAKTSFVAESETAPTKGETKKMFSTSYTAQDVVNGLGPLTPLDERSVKQMVFGMQKEGDPTAGTKFRVATVDSAAAIEEKFSRTFNGAVRNNLGKLNPMGLYRQALDYSKLLSEYFQNGTLVKDKDTGLYRTVGKGEGAPIDVFPLIYSWGEKTGRSKEAAEQFASRVLEAKRLDEVLKINPDFPKHLSDRDRALLVAEYNSDPVFAQMNAAMDKPRLDLIDKMVDVGRLSKETATEWKSVIGYVPFDRIEDFTDKFSTVKKTTGRSPLALTKDPELVGSFKRPVGNVFENYLNTMGWMVGQVMNNDARVQTLTGLQELGFTKAPARMPGTENRSAKAYVNGELRYWELPSRYDVAAFQDLNPPKMAIMRTLGTFSNILRKSVTLLPPFALKQVTDDVQRAMLTSGVKSPTALLRMTLANFGSLAWAELRGIQHPIVKEFGALGLTGEYDFQAGKPALSVLKDLGYRERTVAGSKLLGTLLHRLDGITRASDLAVRKAIYDQTMIETNKDQLLAQSRAREFINFRRRGSSEAIAIATATIPFFNAYVQGMDVLYRAASGNDSSSSVGRSQARQLFWSRAGTVAMLSTMYALMSGDDEDYQEMDLRTRNSNWILPGGYKIPVPGELGALFKVIPETVIEYLRRSGTPEEQTALEAIRSAGAYMAEQYIGRTVPIPQAVKPLIEAWTNYSFFTGRELEGIYQKQQDPSMRVTSKTSELAQAISNFSRDVIGVDAVSPIQIDNMLSGYIGSTAALVTMMTDSLLNPSRVDRPLHKYALLSNYMYDPVGTRRLTEFYDEREKVGKANNTLRQLMKTDIARAETYAEAHQTELALESAVNSTLEQLERTRAYRKFLNSPDGAADMSKDDREKELEEIKKMEVEYTRWVREAKAELRKEQR